MIFLFSSQTAKRNERESNHHSKDKNGSGSYFHQGDPLDSEEDVDDPDDIDDDSVILSPIINIETDEMMPPHGELSGQDSMSENSLWSNHVSFIILHRPKLGCVFLPL